VRLGQVTLFVADLQASRRFYGDGLGLEPVWEGPSFVLLAAPGAGRTGCRLGLHATDDPARRSAGVDLHLEVEDLDAAVQAAAARGVRFLGPAERRPWGARSAVALDPDGHRVELVAWDPGAAP
jgi:catechol 2,3-dioxygenase-like lactoylglutathione lyase family enzyme